MCFDTNPQSSLKTQNNWPQPGYDPDLENENKIENQDFRTI